ncbi:MAG: aldo/keto reductase, partial [Thaumarchaeota archaeon]|nr:aldo/keto reductase [Nitrososphaerota archaeon]
TDYLDLYQLHNPPEDVLRKGDVFNALDDLKTAGKIRFYGVSVTTPSEGVLALNYDGVSSIQVVYNMLEQGATKALFPEAQRRNAAIIARVPLATGFLSGKYTVDSVFSDNDRRKTWGYETRAEYISKVEKLRFVSNSSRSMAQAALSFVLTNKVVSTVIPGCKNVKQVEENVAASRVESLSDGELAKVQDLYARSFN